LLDEYLPGRFAFHDLLRAYAAELAADDDNNADRAQVTGRFLGHYLHTAHAATRLLDPGRDLLPLEQAPGGTTPEVFTSYAAALSWFEIERPVLLAVIRLASEAGFDYTAAYLPATLTDFLYLRGYWHDLTAIQRTALDAARRGGDVAAEALAHRNLARSHILNSNYTDARIHYERALELYRGLGDHIGQARTHSSMSHVWRASGQDDAALSHGEQALSQFRMVGHREGQAIALNEVGWSHARLGDYQQALTCCAEGLDLCRELGDRHTEAATWDTLGYARHCLGDYREAIACFQQALAIFRDVSDRYNESDTLVNLGDSSHALGDTRAAQDAWQRALDILHDLGHARASLVESRLDDLLPG
jgi:tetratricopeptide (TPR) repeat protein